MHAAGGEPVETLDELGIVLHGVEGIHVADEELMVIIWVQWYDKTYNLQMYRGVGVGLEEGGWGWVGKL